MLHRVFTALNEDSRRGDFVFLTNKDRNDLDIDLTNQEIEIMSKLSWKKLIKKIKIKEQHLIISQKKTRRKKIQKLKMSEYLYKNKNTMFSKVIFSTRARTLDIKENNAWKYEKKICVLCAMRKLKLWNILSIVLDMESHLMEMGPIFMMKIVINSF